MKRLGRALLDDPSDATALAACRGVTVAYDNSDGSVPALRGVDLEVESRGRLALWGRSGSGKTTLLHLLGGLLAPTQGHVLWRGRQLPALGQVARHPERRVGVAYVFQGANLLPSFTALENVAFAAEATPAAHAGHRPVELLELVGLGQKLDNLPAELSGGEAQRVALARALAQSPELLLCDEPSGQLDSETGTRVLDLVDALQAGLGFALVVATHDADVAARYERAVALADGRVVPGASI
ncbi:MAG: ABC transporter ATP-binding protein [Thermoleophilaceae bacterium]